jgi:DNA-binding GntR family transcriptional regulator
MPARRRSALLFKLAVHRTGSSQQGILDELRRVILDGAVPPGTPIPISEIAELFGVSNIPVRESLKTLKGEGLVQHRPNIGYAVAQLTASELAEMYIVRETLESAALAAAVARATDADREHVAEVNRLLEKAVREDDPQAYHRQSRHFHIGLTRPSRMHD